MEENDWESLEPMLQQLGEKLLRARWATGFKIDESGVAFSGTRLGQLRLRQLWNILRELDAHTLEEQELAFLFRIARKEAKRHRWK
jgi:hypothetical protein